MNDWTQADEISDQIIAVINAQLKVKVDPEQIIAGLCLGLLGFLRTAPRGVDLPLSLLTLQLAAATVVSELSEPKETLH